MGELKRISDYIASAAGKGPDYGISVASTYPDDGSRVSSKGAGWLSKAAMEADDSGIGPTTVSVSSDIATKEYVDKAIKEATEPSISRPFGAEEPWVDDDGNLLYHGKRFNKIDYHGHVFKEVTEAEKTIRKWRLPGVETVDDLKKAPKGICKELITAITRISMDSRATDALIALTRHLREEGKLDIGGNPLGSVAFRLGMAYDACGFGPKDAEDEAVARVIGILQSPGDSGEAGKLIREIEHDAMRDGR